jgi:hypothetical protein
VRDFSGISGLFPRLKLTEEKEEEEGGGGNRQKKVEES